jgi:hypothetical protein
LDENPLLRFARKPLVYYKIGLVPQSAITTLAEKLIVFNDYRQLVTQLFE